jgi:hypothetical protein
MSLGLQIVKKPNKRLRVHPLTSKGNIERGVKMTERGIRWKAPHDEGWLERFREHAGPKLGQLFPLPAKELPTSLADTLRRLEQAERVATEKAKDSREDSVQDMARKNSPES